MPVINVPKPLRDKLGEEGSESLVVLLNQVTKDQQEDIVALVGEKFERRLAEELAKFRAEVAAEFASVRIEIASVRLELGREIAAVRSEFKEYLAAMRAELKEDIANLRAELRSAFKTDIAALRSEIIKWMFIFWVGQLGALISILFAFFRK